METTTRSPVIRDGLGVGIAVGLSGVAFGAAAVTAGLSVAQACVLSLFAFTGASQFALAGVVAGGGSLAAGAVGALLLGVRNGLYGLRLSGLLGARGWRRLPLAHGVIDETTAVALAQPDAESARTGFLVTFGSLYLTWNATTLLGALGTSRVADPAVFGLDVVGPATFLAILWPRLTGSGPEARELRMIAAGGAAVALAATPFTPAGVPVLLAAAAVLAVLLRRPR
ncbi:branched-chain amino acid ABC transporter permease [Planomonospora parontospora subsp. parontospora]|uniref:Branched-chain amino acid ABC transporter permease n=2 Tax=Planomonospora parontospora TaxID=58119 RepID=A0AA37BC14_9ACTN|nr:AzlC family ABC transporter permease [Planomonospora parontospora]GGK47963.1 branched-chain amino acid ABC transporter permease [Planomonospora parontospora]GII06659.1 branched-chain amino acid ABC transporter permease [Planomonospora parontospora subsp. parontospora]